MQHEEEWNLFAEWDLQNLRQSLGKRVEEYTNNTVHA